MQKDSDNKTYMDFSGLIFEKISLYVILKQITTAFILLKMWTVFTGKKGSVERAVGYISFLGIILAYSISILNISILKNLRSFAMKKPL